MALKGFNATILEAARKYLGGAGGSNDDVVAAVEALGVQLEDVKSLLNDIKTNTTPAG